MDSVNTVDATVMNSGKRTSPPSPERVSDRKRTCVKEDSKKELEFDADEEEVTKSVIMDTGNNEGDGGSTDVTSATASSSKVIKEEPTSSPDTARPSMTPEEIKELKLKIDALGSEEYENVARTYSDMNEEEEPLPIEELPVQSQWELQEAVTEELYSTAGGTPGVEPNMSSQESLYPTPTSSQLDSFMMPMSPVTPLSPISEAYSPGSSIEDLDLGVIPQNGHVDDDQEDEDDDIYELN